MKNKKVMVWLPLLFSVTMIVGMYLGYKMKEAIPGRSFFYVEKRRPVQEVLDLIENKYVDNVDMNRITDTAIQAILYQLDPHSVFIPPDEAVTLKEDLSGRFFGIGIEFTVIDDTINVTNVLKDGPSAQAGIETGDKLLKIDDSTVSGVKISSEKVRKLVRGAEGSDVKLILLHNSNQKVVNVKRASIPLTSLDASYMVNNSIGYIRLNKFSQETYREFMIALENLQKQGMTKLMLDLRDNGGGILDDAVEIADEFLDGNKLITYIEGKHSKKKEYRCKRPGLFEKGSLVVLADEGSASASEILVGALQDWDRATIIGRQTFGKGLVQEQFALSDGSALRLTIARYYTPLGRSIQRSYSNGQKAYYDEIFNRYQYSETGSTDSIKKDLGKAFITHGGKTVYEGNGITPDIFIGFDTTLNNIDLTKLYLHNTISDFAYKFYITNKNILAKYNNNIDDFIKNFSLPEKDWNQFILQASRDSIKLDKITSNEKKAIDNRLKAYIARIGWDSKAFFQTLNASDPAYQKAIEILK